MRIVFTPRQIVQRIGRREVCKLLDVSKEAPRKWYATGIPARHWPTLVESNKDWLTFDLLNEATKIATRPVRKR